MGKVSDYLEQLLRKQLDEHGIVVWYDPEGQYRTFLQRLEGSEVPVLTYDGSFFQLRHRLEPYLKEEKPQQVLVYLPISRDKEASPMIEAECAGKVVEPGGVTGRNTRLEVLVRAALAGAHPREEINELCSRVANGLLSLEEVDRLVEEGAAAKTGLLSMVFDGQKDTQAITLSFLTSDRYDARIEEKKAGGELINFLNQHFGFTTGGSQQPAEVRRAFTRYLFVSDFLSNATDAGALGALASIPHAEKPPHVQACRDLLEAWRNRLDWREAYLQAAQEVEETLHLAGMNLPPEAILPCQAFPIVDRRLLSHTEALILSGDLQQAREIILTRKSGFWALARPWVGLHWQLLELVVEILQQAERIQSELKSREYSPADMVRAYATGEGTAGESWHGLDTLYRRLEQHYVDYEPEDDGDQLDKVIALARNRYRVVVGEMATAFSAALETSGFAFPGLLHQTQIFEKYVRPLLGSDPVAYLLVDALRYEMAQELFAALDRVRRKALEPALAAVPTVTEVGMAALLPEADKGFELTEDRGLQAAISAQVLKDRKQRMEYLKTHVSLPLAVFKLEEVLKPKRSVQKKVQESRLVVVTSQEIDALCELDDLHLARRYMHELLDSLVRAIRSLGRMGVRHVVVVADHGFLLGEELQEGEKTDTPGGQTLLLHRRCWAGKGGNASPSFLRLTAKDLSMTGDWELAFPRGTNCFKVQGGGQVYFHGGISLQELVIPVLTLELQAEKAVVAKPAFDLTMEKKKITTRFFTVKVRYRLTEIFGEDAYRVRLEVRQDSEVVGSIATALYGLQEGTQELTLEKDKDNVVTFMLREGIMRGTVSVHLFDAETGQEVQRLENVEVDISI